MNKLIAISTLLFAACTDSGPRIAAPGDSFTVTWAVNGSLTMPVNQHSGPGVPRIYHFLECTTTVNNPCSYINYSHRLDINDDGMVWLDASGAKTISGDDVSILPPFADMFELADDGSINLAGRSDDPAGIRHATVLTPTGDGYSGAVTWELNTPDYLDTSFNLTLTFE